MYILFLPAAGYRNGLSVDSTINYWARTVGGTLDTASKVVVRQNGFWAYINWEIPYYANALRLASVVSEELIGLAKDCPFMMSKD